MIRIAGPISTVESTDGSDATARDVTEVIAASVNGLAYGDDAPALCASVTPSAAAASVSPVFSPMPVGSLHYIGGITFIQTATGVVARVGFPGTYAAVTFVPGEMLVTDGNAIKLVRRSVVPVTTTVTADSIFPAGGNQVCRYTET